MTYTVATMKIPTASHAWIEKKLRDAGYDHAIHGKMLDMTHIGLIPMDDFVFAGQENCSLTDAAKIIMKAAFEAGYEAALDHACSPGPIAYTETCSSAFELWADETNDRKDDVNHPISIFVDGFSRLRAEATANIEARNQPYQDIIRRAADLMK